MNTIQRISSVLRGITLAGLAAATLWAAAPAYAAIDASDATPRGQQTSEPKTLPAPVLVAPCAQCMKSPPQGLALPAPILVAPCGQCIKSPLQGLALPAPILVAPNCGSNCRPAVTPIDVRVVPPSLLLAGGEPPIVVDSWWRRLFG